MVRRSLVVDRDVPGPVQHDAAASAAGYDSTPTVTIQGPKGMASAIVGLPTSFSQIQSAINSVE